MTNSQPPIWRNYRFWQIAIQVVAIIIALGTVNILWNNANHNLRQLGISLGWDFLERQASFDIGESLVKYDATDSYGRALGVGLVNSLRVATLGILFATVVGITAGIGRLSDNWLVRNISLVYVEIFRNTPLLLQLLFWYFGVFLSLPRPENKISLFGLGYLSQNGIDLPTLTYQGVNLTPEFSTLLLGLTFYTGAFIAEIVRAGIKSVSQGQREAGLSLGLRPGLLMRLIIFPQALKLIVPPLTSQYLNLMKNSSLAIAIGYPDIYFVASTTFNQTGKAVEVMILLMITYLTLSLTISIVMNLVNRTVQIKER
ncbi:amino acid ABC transporter permease [Cylindrospermopsis raciborskii S07]|uniref:Amino acid ABC transporter permease n=1 Tax=Cylindrospermopsis raciborskii CS-505 TaxID=533240 RepID=A0A853MB96_9CYAN|nr:ABC transporter permease subunit [Cylindrospermopsis raciborskii]EFA70106.1 Amino acid ABC transporter, permease protein, 3- TM region protein, His/Glu/Gln/Arg/opine [Cylindrospermopsis raciborskii CS-505]OBU76501.1 amino acid ABC transporter permease [Cylindrospermopsis raciborskii CS-505]PNK04441.1 amino acid ABC transporter permease [Cylindrospermopsis raciborskii S14]PNK06191.1 amino acid ABC transporter permease [Cylindrospermopsis raciborskii S10]PNK10031.1 amino acid ABC transporter 